MNDSAENRTENKLPELLAIEKRKLDLNLIFDEVIPCCIDNNIPEKNRASFLFHVYDIVDKNWNGNLDKDDLQNLIKEVSGNAISDYKTGKLDLNEVCFGDSHSEIYKHSKLLTNADLIEEMNEIVENYCKETKCNFLEKMNFEWLYLKDKLCETSEWNFENNSYHLDQLKFLCGSEIAEGLAERINENIKAVVCFLEAEIRKREEYFRMHNHNIEFEFVESEKQDSIKPIERIRWLGDEPEIEGLFKVLKDMGKITAKQFSNRHSLIKLHFESDDGKPFDNKQLAKSDNRSKNSSKRQAFESEMKKKLQEQPPS
jgi:hypothetical protein